MSFVLRKPCRCGSSEGRIETRNGQDCAYCVVCNTHQYNAPKTETGRAARTVSTVHEAIKPKQRSRILIRANGRCELCGKGDGCNLHVGHMIGVKRGLEIGLTEAELNNDENLCSLCDECNLGIGDDVIPLRLAVSIVMARLRNRGLEF